MTFNVSYLPENLACKWIQLLSVSLLKFATEPMEQIKRETSMNFLAGTLCTDFLQALSAYKYMLLPVVAFHHCKFLFDDHRVSAMRCRCEICMDSVPISACFTLQNCGHVHHKACLRWSLDCNEVGCLPDCFTCRKQLNNNPLSLSDLSTLVGVPRLKVLLTLVRPSPNHGPELPKIEIRCPKPGCYATTLSFRPVYSSHQIVPCP